MITVRQAERADILKIIVDLSPASVFDIKLMGTSPDETLGFFAMRVPEKDAVAFVEDGEPIALLGWDKTPDKWLSWMLTTPHSLSRDAHSVSVARRHMASMAARLPDVELCSIMGSNAKHIRRWMRYIGFSPAPETGERAWRFVG